MTLYEEFLAYRDQYGLNGLYSVDGKGQPTQNGALFTMEYLICLIESDQLDPLDLHLEFNRLIDVYTSLERQKGITSRTPQSTEGDSMDNSGSVAAFSGLIGGGLAKRMKEYGESVQCTGVQDQQYYLLARFVTAAYAIWRPKMLWSFIKNGFKPMLFWNNENPGVFTTGQWFGRSPGHLGMYDLAAQGYTSPFRWLAVLVGQFLGCFADVGNTDARKLPYVGWYFLTHGTKWWDRWFWKLAYRVWVYVLLRQYPNGMRDVYSIYYGDPNHPIRKYSKRYFGEES